jgi:hypothetical protein
MTLKDAIMVAYVLGPKIGQQLREMDRDAAEVVITYRRLYGDRENPVLRVDFLLAVYAYLLVDPNVMRRIPVDGLAARVLCATLDSWYPTGPVRPSR